MNFSLSKIILLGMVCYFSHTSRAQAEKTLLKIGYYDLPPHAMKIDQSPKGASIDYLSKTIFKKDLYQINWVHLPFARMLAQVETKKLDIGILVAKTAPRMRKFKYPETFIYETRSGVIALPNSKIKSLKTLIQLKGKTLGHVTMSIRPKNLLDAGVIFEEISGSNNLRRNLQKLKHKRIDGVYLPTLSHGRYFIKTNLNQENFKILELPLDGHKLFLVFRKGLNQKVIDHFDQQNKNHNVKYQKILQKFLK